MRQQARPPSRIDILRFVAVHADAPLPLATQLRQQLAALIASGQVKPGDRMPPVREAARQLGINWHTVRAAYQQLQADGMLTMRQGKGSVVQPRDAQQPHQRAPNPPTFTVGVLIPGLNPFYTPFINGIEETAREGPWLLLVCYTHDEPQLADRYLDQLIAKHVDGLIVAGLPDMKRGGEPTQGSAGMLLPIVHVDKPDAPGHVVLLDSEGAGQAATRHLIEHGHKRIGLISGPLEAPNLRQCYVGYKRALRSAGLDVEAELIAEVPSFTIESGRQAAQQLLERPNPPTAIFAAADLLAIGAMQCAEARRLRVPEDVAIVGYNNIDLAALVKPALTTVSAPSYDMGAAAMSMLVELMAGRAPKRRRIKLPTRLIVRCSCGCRG